MSARAGCARASVLSPAGSPTVMSRRSIRPLAALVLLLAAAGPALALDARMLREPDVSADSIVFVYAGDLWLVPKGGGLAHQLSTPPGEESFPRFSPDGRSIAFTGNYHGNLDVYVVSVDGGVPRRLTWHPLPDRVVDWTPDGSAVIFASRRLSGKERFDRLFTVSPEGGEAKVLPPAYAELASLKADGRTLAMTQRTRDFRTWKRYRGGMAPDIWLFDLETLEARRLTDSDANDSVPMWRGDTLYFLSDRDANKRYNVWSWSEADGFRPLTAHQRYDVRFPAVGPSDLVYEVAGRLHRIDLASGEDTEVAIEVVTDAATLLPRPVAVGEAIEHAAISPSGKRALFEARGELFTVPAEHGVVRNLTQSSGVAERNPAWSPDGKWIAYFSDATGEYELTVRPADGSGEPRTVTALGPGFRYRPFFSPDSGKVAWIDQAKAIHVADVASGAVTEIDRGLWETHGALEPFRVSWSPDSRFVAWSRAVDNVLNAVFVHDTRDGRTRRVTSGFYSAQDPVFSADGKALFFTLGRRLVPSYSDFDGTWVYANSRQLVALPLTADGASPLAPRNDIEEGANGGDDAAAAADKEAEGEKGEKGQKGQKGKEGKSKDADEDDDEGGETPEPVVIDFDGLESRMVVLPVDPGNLDRLGAVAGKVLYLRGETTGATEGPFPGDAGTLELYDLEEREVKTVLAEVEGYELAAGGEKLLVATGAGWGIVDPAPDQKVEKPLDLAAMETVVDPRAEWRQLFDDAWRLERDYFYDPNLHGVDWAEMRERYGGLLDDAVTRWDVNFVIGELIAELNSSHAYRGGGDQEEGKERGIGLLGADFTLDRGAWRIAEIVDVAPWETEARSPLREPGVEVDEGDWLLAVNGVALDPTREPWSALDGLAGATVVLTVNDRPTTEGAREVLVETLASAERLRNLAWVEAKRRRVEEATGGRCGYIFVPSTGIGGQTELVRQFYAQTDKTCLVVDERFNNGGQIPDRFIELLGRQRLNYWAVRDGRDWPWPFTAVDGPKVMLINGWSGSGGDLFPLYFRQAGLGPLIGTRTWGGLIGVSGNPGLVDGGGITVPTFAIYDLEGRWIVEGHGVDPDIEVLEDPGALARGVDNQLEVAIEEVLRRLEADPPEVPGRPAYQDRSGS